MKKEIKLVLALLGVIILFVSIKIVYDLLKENNQPNNLVVVEEKENDSENNESTNTLEETTEVEISKEETTQTEQVAEEKYDFTVTTLEGEEVKLSSFFGKPIVLNFWASWCPPCRSEMPDFEKVYKEIGEDVTFLMINLTDGTRETKEVASEFILDEGYTFPVYYDNKQEASKEFSVTGIPTTYFFDKDGKLITYAQGAISEEVLREAIEMTME